MGSRFQGVILQQPRPGLVGFVDTKKKRIFHHPLCSTPGRGRPGICAREQNATRISSCGEALATRRASAARLVDGEVATKLAHSVASVCRAGPVRGRRERCRRARPNLDATRPDQRASRSTRGARREAGMSGVCRRAPAGLSLSTGACLSCVAPVVRIDHGD